MDVPPKHLGFTHSQKNIFISFGDLKSALLAFFLHPNRIPEHPFRPSNHQETSIRPWTDTLIILSIKGDYKDGK